MQACSDNVGGCERTSLIVVRGAYVKSAQCSCSKGTNNYVPSISVSPDSLAFAVAHYTFNPDGVSPIAVGWNTVGISQYSYAAAWCKAYPSGGNTSSPYIQSAGGVNDCTEATIELALT